MKPIEIRCAARIPAPAAVICQQIADTARWSDFRGYAILPGIERAEYEVRTETLVGSRIRVHNTDGSEHVEEIVRWDPDSRIEMRMQDFTPPLSRLAAQITEDWRLDEQAETTLVTRTVRLHPKTRLTRPAVWLISLLFRKAIERNLRELVASG